MRALPTTDSGFSKTAKIVSGFASAKRHAVKSQEANERVLKVIADEWAR
jgi:hypothetical protein